MGEYRWFLCVWFLQTRFFSTVHLYCCENFADRGYFYQASLQLLLLRHNFSGYFKPWECFYRKGFSFILDWFLVTSIWHIWKKGRISLKLLHWLCRVIYRRHVVLTQLVVSSWMTHARLAICTSWSMTEYSNRAPGYLSTFGTISDPWMPDSFNGTTECRYLCCNLPYMSGAWCNGGSTGNPSGRIDELPTLRCIMSTDPFTVWVGILLVRPFWSSRNTTSGLG